MRVVLFSDGFQLALIVADTLCQRAYFCSRMGSKAGMSASGMCSEALLWKLLAGHLGRRAPMLAQGEWVPASMAIRIEGCAEEKRRLIWPRGSCAAYPPP
jgi:hypothetical protein